MSYMKEVLASSGPIRMPQRPCAVWRSTRAQSSPSHDDPAHASSYAPVWRGSRRDAPSSRGRNRLFQARSSPDLPASVPGPLQRCVAVWTHPPTGATAPRAPRHPSSPGETVPRRSTDRGTLAQSGQCSTGDDLRGSRLAVDVMAELSMGGLGVDHPGAYWGKVRN